MLFSLVLLSRPFTVDLSLTRINMGLVWSAGNNLQHSLIGILQFLRHICMHPGVTLCYDVLSYYKPAIGYQYHSSKNPYYSTIEPTDFHVQHPEKI